MTFDDFQRSLVEAEPPGELTRPLAALWWDRKGDWDRGHSCVQDAPGPDAAWVHAYLHRREGDADNAAYWYRLAGQPIADAALDDEATVIAATLLARAA